MEIIVNEDNRKGFFPCADKYNEGGHFHPGGFDKDLIFRTIFLDSHLGVEE